MGVDNVTVVVVLAFISCVFALGVVLGWHARIMWAGC